MSEIDWFPIVEWRSGEDCSVVIPAKLYVFPDPVSFPDETVYTVSNGPGAPGWITDSGYDDYGLPREIAMEIVRRYNERNGA